MRLEELAAMRPDLADFHYAGCVVDGVYLDEDAAGGPRWTAHVTHLSSGEVSVFHEARCQPNCLRGCDRPYRWVEEDHACCAGCVADPAHRYQSVHE